MLREVHDMPRIMGAGRGAAKPDPAQGALGMRVWGDTYATFCEERKHPAVVTTVPHFSGMASAFVAMVNRPSGPGALRGPGKLVGSDVMATMVPILVGGSGGGASGNGITSADVEASLKIAQGSMCQRGGLGEAASVRRAGRLCQQRGAACLTACVFMHGSGNTSLRYDAARYA